MPQIIHTSDVVEELTGTRPKKDSLGCAACKTLTTQPPELWLFTSADDAMVLPLHPECLGPYLLRQGDQPTVQHYKEEA